MYRQATASKKGLDQLFLLNMQINDDNKSTIFCKRTFSEALKGATSNKYLWGQAPRLPFLLAPPTCPKNCSRLEPPYNCFPATPNTMAVGLAFYHTKRPSMIRLSQSRRRPYSNCSFYLYYLSKNAMVGISGVSCVMFWCA